MSMTDRILMAPYGTLRVGHGNWAWAFRNAEIVMRDDVVPGYCMKSNGGIPAVFEVAPPEDGLVVVDVLDITDMPERDAILASVDRMEFGCGYFRRLIRTTHGHEAWMYVMLEDQKHRFRNEVPNGDWNTWPRRHY